MNKQIVCFSSSDWHVLWGSRQQVMQLWAKQGFRVLYVEQLAGLEHFYKNKHLSQNRLIRWREGLRQIEPNLWLATPPILSPGRYYSHLITRLNAWLTMLKLQPILTKLEINKPIVWVYKPEHVALLPYFPHSPVIYHCIDEFTVGTSGRKKQHIIEQESQLLQQANLVFANSQLTYENKQTHNPHTYRIPSAANVEHFTQALDPLLPIAPAIASLPHPRLGFIGNLGDKIDAQLLFKIAHTRPDWSIVLVGQLYAHSFDITPLQTLSNVHWLGNQPFDQLPHFAKGFDLCLLPYKQDDTARYRSPLKLYEYLATGRPIVSTPHPEVNEFSSFITITAPHLFVQAIQDTLQSDTPAQREQRLQLASQHSWSNRVQTMLNHMQNLL